MNPTFEYEKILWEKDYKFVAGADEVGRGAFAGPVVAAAVMFSQTGFAGNSVVQIRDSKKMTAKEREKSAKWIKENTYWGIGESSVNTINRLGIVKAANVAFRKAIIELKIHTLKIDHLLIDAFYIPFVKGINKRNQTPIIKGDCKSISIAAASILAKVYRDEVMREIGGYEKYKKYFWELNAGYGTKQHRDAIILHGITRHHRTQYVETFLSRVL